jgi:muramoyltetrapeptide carboxypeptidase
MQNLKHSGILSNIAGLVVGNMSGMKQGADKYNASIEGIILDAVKEYSYPVCFNFPSGHESENMALIMGQEYHLQVSHTLFAQRGLHDIKNRHCFSDL